MRNSRAKCEFSGLSKGLAVCLLASLAFGQHQSRPLPVGRLPQSAASATLDFMDGRNGWMHTTSQLWRTVDAGRSWEEVLAPLNSSDVGLLNGAQFFNANRGWI